MLAAKPLEAPPGGREAEETPCGEPLIAAARVEALLVLVILQIIIDWTLKLLSFGAWIREQAAAARGGPAAAATNNNNAGGGSSGPAYYHRRQEEYFDGRPGARPPWGALSASGARPAGGFPLFFVGAPASEPRQLSSSSPLALIAGFRRPRSPGPTVLYFPPSRPPGPAADKKYGLDRAGATVSGVPEGLGSDSAGRPPQLAPAQGDPDAGRRLLLFSDASPVRQRPPTPPPSTGRRPATPVGPILGASPRD